MAGLLTTPQKQGGPPGIKSAPWFSKKKASERRAESAVKRQRFLKRLFSFKAIGERASLPEAQLGPEERQKLASLETLLLVSTTFLCLSSDLSS